MILDIALGILLAGFLLIVGAFLIWLAIEFWEAFLSLLVGAGVLTAFVIGFSEVNFTAKGTGITVGALVVIGGVWWIFEKIAEFIKARNLQKQVKILAAIVAAITAMSTIYLSDEPDTMAIVWGCFLLFIGFIYAISKSLDKFDSWKSNKKLAKDRKLKGYSQ